MCRTTHTWSQRHHGHLFVVVLNVKCPLETTGQCTNNWNFNLKKHLMNREVQIKKLSRLCVFCWYRGFYWNWVGHAVRVLGHSRGTLIGKVEFTWKIVQIFIETKQQTSFYKWKQELTVRLTYLVEKARNRFCKARFLENVNNSWIWKKIEGFVLKQLLYKEFKYYYPSV